MEGIRHISTQTIALYTMACLILISSVSLAQTPSAILLARPKVQTMAPAVKGRIDAELLQADPWAMTALRESRVAQLTLPFHGQFVTFDRVFSKKRDITTTWIGKNPDEKAYVLLTFGNDHFFGRAEVDGEALLFSPTRLPYEIEAIVMNPNYAVPLIDDEALPPLEAENRISQRGSGDDGSRIDIMFLYTSAMASAYPGTQIETRIQTLIDEANLSYRNSGINTELRAVYTQEVDYPDDSVGDMSEALDDLTNNTGVFAGVETLRTTYGADQVTLLRQFVDEGCGLAWLLSSDSARYAYAVVQDGDKTDGSGYYCEISSFAHELGHNMGCAHDRANASVAGRFSYSYGYQEPNQAFRTVMAYNCAGGCPRISYFSNPDVYYNGNPTGVDQSSPDSADNVATINQTCIGMAAYRSSVMSATDTRFVAATGDCDGNTPCYTNIQSALDNAADGDTVKVAAATYSGDVATSAGIDILLSCGWDTAYSSQTYSAIDGTLTVGDGTLTVENLIVW